MALVCGSLVLWPDGGCTAGRRYTLACQIPEGGTSLIRDNWGD